MTTQELKNIEREKYNTLYTDCHVFWAFDQKQFVDGSAKHPLQEGEKYVSIGAGGFLPKSNLDNLINGSKEIKAWFSAETKKGKARAGLIAYELNNHECYYTGSIDSALDALGEGYTYEEVKTIYLKTRKKYAHQL